MLLADIQFEDFNVGSAVEVSKIIANSVRQNSLRLVYGRVPNVTLVLGDGSTLSVHGQLLAENSYEFANRISFDQFCDVSIYEADAIRTLLSFLYNGWMNVYLNDTSRLLYVAGAIRMPVCVEALCQYLVHISTQSLAHALSCAEIASNANLYFRADCAARMRMNIAAVVENANNLSLLYEASSVDGIKEILFALQTDTSEQRTRMLLCIATGWLQNRRERFGYAEYIYAMVPFKNLSSHELVEISIALEEQLPNEIYKPLLMQLKQAAYRNHVGVNIINMSSTLSFESPTSFQEAQSSPEVFDEILMPQNSPNVLSTNLNMKGMAAASENGQPNCSRDRVSLVSSSNESSVDSPSIPTIRSPSYGQILPTKNEMLQNGWSTPTSDHERDYYASSSADKTMIADHEISSNVTNEAAFRSPKLQHQVERVIDIAQSVNPVLNDAIMYNDFRGDKWASYQQVRKKESLDVARHCNSSCGIKNSQKDRQTDLTVTIPPYQNTEILRPTNSVQQNNTDSSNHACELKVNSLSDQVTIDKTISEQAINTTQSNRSIMSPVDNRSLKSGRISLVASAEEESDRISESDESEQSSLSSSESQDWPYEQKGLKNTTKNIVKDLHYRRHPRKHNVYGSVVSRKVDASRQKDSRITRAQFDDNRKSQPSKPPVQPDSLSYPVKKSVNEDPCSANQKRTNVTTVPSMGKQLPVARTLAAKHLVLGDDSIISSGSDTRQIDSDAQNLSSTTRLTETQNESKSKAGVANRTEIDLSTARSSSSNDESVRTAKSISDCERSTGHIISSDFENVHHEKQLADKMSPIYGNVDISQDKQKQLSDEQGPVKSATVIHCPESSGASSSASSSAFQVVHSNINMKYNMNSLSKPEAQIEQKHEFPVEHKKQMLGSEYRITTSVITSKDDRKTAKGIPIINDELRVAVDLKEDQKTESDLKTAVDLETSIENQNENLLLRRASKRSNERDSSEGMTGLGIDDSIKNLNKNSDPMQDEKMTDKTPPSPPSENDLHDHCGFEQSDKALKTLSTTSSYTETDLLEKATSSSLSI
ncbi:hypothetical protein Tcan_17393 [Toxocara canis]|uniref:BTB domain-containing protein n=1 Tax=Toxocara canis TaxID=6265 RepID=A0A0B2W125_TOXCA|nr:hypothetical protein Tcan_17393 [Toxocara canis]